MLSYSYSNGGYENFRKGFYAADNDLIVLLKYSLDDFEPIIHYGTDGDTWESVLRIY